METLSPIGFNHAAPGFAMKAPGEGVTPPANSQNEDLDGCDVQCEVPTSDEELPAAEGGIA